MYICFICMNELSILIPAFSAQLNLLGIQIHQDPAVD